MEKRIELERRARKANQISELNLDNCRSTSIVGFNDEYTALETLSLINVGLTTLKGFPKLPNLKKLELSDNRISNGLHYLATSPSLQSLNLSGNKIKDLETLKPLQEFKNLAVLDLFNNEATQIENYREKIFEMLPSLKYLDGFDCNDIEVTSDGDDDDEVNGNDSEDEDQNRNAFCINGLEIDLDELEAFEKHLQAKKQTSNSSVNVDTTTTTVISKTKDKQNVNETETENVTETETELLDDLDLHLQQLQLKDARERNKSKQFENCVAAGDTTVAVPAAAATASCDSKNVKSFAILLFWLLSILQLANIACFSEVMGDDVDDNDDSDDVEDDDDEDVSDSEDNGDVSLAEVYNEDLEEDNSDWEEQDAGEEDDDDDEDDEEADGEANESTASAADKDVAGAAGDEPQARGKKRKHEG